jgi:hypothetical protein
LSILAIDKDHPNRQLRKTVRTYLILSLAAIAVDHIYAIFGHGVSSDAMTWMFLYPLLGGALFYFLVERLAPGVSRAPGYRLSYNIYNSGIATLTVAGLLKGILDIAGAASAYTGIFRMSGWALAAAGTILLIIKPLRYAAGHRPE